MKSIIGFAVTLFFSTIVFAMGSNTPKQPEPDKPSFESPLEPTYTSIKWKILMPRCSECHRAGTSWGGFSAVNYDYLMDHIVAGKPEESELYEVVAPDEDGYQQMPPKKRPKLSAEEVKVIYDWIKNGAFHN